MEKTIEIPEGYEARIEGNKVILEPKESEDEMIRKELIGFIQEEIDSINRLVSGDYDDRDADDIAHQNWCKKVLVWLEKQGEQKSVLDNILKEAFDKSRKDYPIEDKKEAIEYSDSILPTSVVSGESEEEYMLHTIMEAAFIAGQNKLQNNQNLAWSEEDENRFRNLIFLVEHSNEGKGTKEGFVKFIYRLKSLKERYTWKPSEQDILLLERIVNGKSNPQDFQASLCGLIGQLKELKG